MEFPIPESWKRLWEKVDIRVFIMLSFCLQIILILFAPLRKRTGNKWVMMALWSVYSLADWAATFALGLISNSVGESCTASDHSQNSDLLAFWAPFLLLHLGGPDTITAFALEDNELWLRHFFGLLVQCLVAVYIYFQSLPNNKLWIPTLLMFIAGIIKYAERTRSLYLASLNVFRQSMLKKPDPGPNYIRIMNLYSSMKEANLPVSIHVIPEPELRDRAMYLPRESKLTDREIVRHAHNFFKDFKGLIVDLIFSHRQRYTSQEFFFTTSPEDAVKVVEVELNLMYAALFTKFSMVYTGLGYLGRFISFASVVASLALFYTESKGVLDSVDIATTYILLCGAIAMDIIAFLMLIRSDWFLPQIMKLIGPFLWPSPKTNMVNLEKPRVSCFGRLKRFYTRRWSESCSQFNLIYYCLHPRPPVKEKFIGYLGLTNFLDSLKYVTNKSFTDELRDHIFEELKMKSEIADDLETGKEITAGRGDWVLYMEHQRDLLRYILDFEYDQSLLLWHIATELCYNEEISEENPEAPSYNKHRKISKLLSDYMIYLMIMQPTIMSAVTGIGEVSFRDTCAEAKRFFFLEGNQREPNICLVIGYFIRSVFKYLFYSFIGISLFLILIFAFIVALIFSFIFVFALLISLLVWKYRCGGTIEGKTVLEMAEKSCFAVMEYFSKEKADYDEKIEACKQILRVNISMDPVILKGDMSKSVLFDGCILAKKLDDLGENKWELMSKVWVELLSCAAIHTRATTHAQQLTKGGELITLVWLLMTHFGIGNQFEAVQPPPRTQIFVGK